MCRLFGMLSVEVSNAREYLLNDPCSLYVQSNVNPESPQGDGWGIGFYVDGAPRLLKSGKPVYQERERFKSAVRQANSKIILAHIRKASNPRGLPREKVISVENSQPFRHENYLFAHNGTITIPDEVAESLGEWKGMIRGLNDSEVYFWHVVKALTDGVTVQNAFSEFEQGLSELWEKSRGKHLDKDRPYIGLNALLSDGEKLYAYCKYHERDNSARSLCLGNQPAFQMSYLITPERLVAASEKTDDEDDWKPLKSGQLLVGEIRNREVKLDLRKIT